MALTWVKALKSARIINSPLQSGQAALAYHCNPNDGAPQTTTTCVSEDVSDVCLDRAGTLKAGGAVVFFSSRFLGLSRVFLLFSPRFLGFLAVKY